MCCSITAFTTLIRNSGSALTPLGLGIKPFSPCFS
nr:TmoA [uncultured bacterium]